LAGAGGADGAGTETRAGSVGDCCVEGGADDGDVVVFGGFDETFYRAEVGEAGDAGEGPLKDKKELEIGLDWIELGCKVECWLGVLPPDPTS
jgi:hypothetical protein